MTPVRGNGSPVGIRNMDIQYLLFLQHARETLGGVFNSFFLQISDLSSGMFVWLLACVVFWSVNKKVGGFLFLNVGFSRFFMQVLKLTFCVYRPWIRSAEILPIEKASGYSFPSGHTVTATANYGTLVERYRQSRPLCIFLALMILLTMFSRNYIGVHTPQDVVVALLLGIVVVLCGARVWEWLEAHPTRDYLLPCAGVVLVTLFLAYISLKNYPLDYVNGKLLVDPRKMMIDGYKDAGRLLGVAFGWFLERRFVRFSLDVPVARRVARAGFGVLLLLLYEGCAMPALTASLASSWGYFVATFFELILLMVIYPLFFAREKKAA